MMVQAPEEVGESTKDAKKEVSTADLVTTAGEVVTTAEDVKVTTAATTPQISKDELTLAHTLIEIKSAKPKARGVIVQEPKVSRNLEAQMKTEMEEEDRIAREKDERLEKEYDSTELKRCLEIVLEDDDDDVAIEATHLSSKSPTIVDYKINGNGYSRKRQKHSPKRQNQTQNGKDQERQSHLKPKDKSQSP
nr:hypothetical protein [Tanacetum cinerariifolium]